MAKKPASQTSHISGIFGLGNRDIPGQRSKTSNIQPRWWRTASIATNRCGPKFPETQSTTFSTRAPKQNLYIPGKPWQHFLSRVWTFFLSVTFFPNTAMSGCKPSTYRTIGFLNSWICRTGSDSISVSSRDSIWGSMLTFDYCFFFNMMLKKYWYFMGTSKFGRKYGSICGQIWAPVGARSRLPICSTSDWNSSFGNCRRMSEPGIVEGFEQPFTIKNQNTQLNKKTCPLLVKPIMDKKNVHTVFQVYIYISVCVCHSAQYKSNLTERCARMWRCVHVCIRAWLSNTSPW